MRRPHRSHRRGKAESCAKERGHFRREQMVLIRQMLRAGDEEPGPGVLDLATWGLGKSHVEWRVGLKTEGEW